ncbi:MAG: L-threonylcarbamoyladenylate synthase [Treponema sp.]|nr:L-threonylcarbamoyladenylate synthase [Treponema sp.]
MICLKSDPSSIDLCVSHLKAGKAVIIPTDTVYGFSGLVSREFDSAAVIRKLKGREESKPFIQLLSDPQQLSKYTNDVISPQLLKFWPGPLTIIVNDLNGSTTAFRCPDEPWLCLLIKKCGAPIYSTSANKSGCPVENDPLKLEEIFGEQVLVIDGGIPENNLASTLVKLDKAENGFSKVTVLRQGPVVIPDSLLS